MEPEERLILISQIRKPEWNSRTVVDPAKLKSLGDSIKQHGQKQAIEVEQLAPDDYLLVFGSRRLGAMQLAGFEEIRARVKEPSTRTARIITNALENVQREDLTTFELARTCSQLREEGLKLQECVESLGMSQSYVSNLAVCYNNLAPDILADWQSGHDAAVVSYLRDLTKVKPTVVKGKDGEPDSKDFSAQIKVWEAHKSSYEAAMDDLYGDGEGEDPEPDKKDAPKNYTIKRETYHALMRALKANKAPALAVNVALFLVGKVGGIKGFIEAPAETDKEEKPKKKNHNQG